MALLRQQTSVAARHRIDWHMPGVRTDHRGAGCAISSSRVYRSSPSTAPGSAPRRGYRQGLKRKLTRRYALCRAAVGHSSNLRKGLAETDEARCRFAWRRICQRAGHHTRCRRCRTAARRDQFRIGSGPFRPLAWNALPASSVMRTCGRRSDRSRNVPVRRRLRSHWFMDSAPFLTTVNGKGRSADCRGPGENIRGRNRRLRSGLTSAPLES